MAFVFAGTRRRFHGVLGSILSKLLELFRQPAGISHPRNNLLSLFFCVRQYLCSDLLAECVSVWWHVRQTINGGERIPASFWSRLRSHTSSWSIFPFFSTASVCPISSSVFSSFSLTSPSLGPRGGHRWPAMAVGSPSGRPPHRLDRPGDRPRVRRKARGHRSPAQAAEYGKHARPLDCCDRIAQACGRARAPSTSTSPSASPEYRARVQSTSPEREPAAASAASAALPSASRRREAREVKYLASNGCSLSQPRREPESERPEREPKASCPCTSPSTCPYVPPPPNIHTRAQHTSSW